MLMTIAESVLVRAASRPERVAIEVLGGPALTYGEVGRRVRALAAAIAEAAPGPHGAMVGLVFPNGADAVLAYLACQLAGHAGVPVNTRLADPEMRFVLEDSGAKTILAGGRYVETAQRLAAPIGARVIVAEAIETPPTLPPPVLAQSGFGERPAVVGYTSGTTGFPKGALYSNDHYLAALMRWGWEFGMSAEEVVLVPGPLFHLSYAGLSMAALMIGARLRIMPDFDPSAALDECMHRATFAFLVPSMTGMIAEEWKRRNRPPVETFRFMISSGAPGPLALTRTAMEMFPRAKVAEAYGWTEGGWVTFEVKRPDTLLAHSVGWPVVGHEVAVFDASGEPCGVGVAGEVGVKNLTCFSGYLGRPEATAAAWHRGYVMSGDIGIWQADGRLCIVDRKKDMIISGGENVYTAEVERVLHDHPNILEAAVVGLPDAKWGELVTAMIVPRAPGLDAEEVRAFCRRHLAGYKVPKRVEIAPALPRNPMGKVQKFKIVAALG